MTMQTRDIQTRRMVNPAGLEVFNDFDTILKGIFTPQRVKSEVASRQNLAIDLLEKQSSYEIKADLPGVNKNDISVTLESGVLTITAESKSAQVDESKVNVIRSERLRGRYRRSVKIGKDVDEDSIKANYKDGVLTLMLDKSEQVLPKKITINA